MNQQEKVFDVLRNLNIEYELMRHTAVFTIEEMDNLRITENGDVCKNLFLSVENAKRHFLVILDKDKRADLKNIQGQLGCSRLSFAPEERLIKYLGVTKGAVTPMGVINDIDASVEIVLDKDLVGKSRLGFHPNDNTATIWITFEGLKSVIENNGNVIHYVTI